MVTKAELDLLETVDVNFLINVLGTPKSSPVEMLYLELGCIPFRELIRKRRISFLHYILNQDQNSMLYKFLMTQLKNRKQKDWVSQVLEDIKDLKLNVDMEEIKLMKKSKLKHILKNSTEEKALEELEKKKAKHSKVMNIKHKQIKMQKYLKSNGLKMNQEEVQTIFKLRSRMTNVKTNFRGKYDNFECELCNEEDENQKHMLECKEIMKKIKVEVKIPEYDELFKGNVREQLEIAKAFLENMKIKEDLNKK